MTEITAITFEDAIAQTQTLLQQLEVNELTEAQLEAIVTQLVATMNGSRGFFVTYLTDERSFADQPTSGILAALKTSPDLVGELLVKNLAMSTAMAIAHERNQKPDLAAGSQRVSRRSQQLLAQLQLETTPTKLKALLESAQTGTGEYQAFLDRWRYDVEQRAAIAACIQQLLAN